MTSPNFALRFGPQTIPIVGSLTLGRTPSCSIVLPDDTKVSRQHARVWVEDDGVMVEDLGSKNGVLVNGERIAGRARLRAGDVLGLGGYRLEVVESVTPTIRRSATRPDGLAYMPGEFDDEPTTEAMLSVPEPIDWQPFRRAMQREDFEQAAILLGKAFERVTLRALARGDLDADVQSKLCEHAFHLASRTKDGGWINRVLHLHMLVAKPMPPTAAVALPPLVHGVRGLDTSMLEAYVQLLRRSHDRLTAVDRQLCAALESALMVAGSDAAGGNNWR
jgi:hypothetical protein